MRLDPAAASVLRAVLSTGMLSFLMACWMGSARLTAMRRQGLNLDDAAHTRDLSARLPSSARRVADNYAHLFEAPTVFYAVALSLVAGGLADSLAATCSWIFFACRALHSLVQATINVVALRMIFYWLSWTALVLMMMRGLWAL